VNTGDEAQREQWATRRKLLEIFLPSAQQTRQDMIKSKGRFVHYTSAENGLKIIKEKTVWMRNTNCMSDYSEVQHGYRTLRNLLGPNGSIVKEFMSALDGCVHGLGAEAFHPFNQWWNDTQFNTYIACLSEHRDREDKIGRLSMWRALVGVPARVALVFKIPLTEAPALSTNLFMLPIAYHTDDEVESELTSVIANINAHQKFLSSIDRNLFVHTINFMLGTNTVCLKHEGFHEEHEWRIIHLPNQGPSSSISASIETVRGIPQTVYKIPLIALAGDDPDRFPSLIDRVIIGPSPYPRPMSDAFVTTLKDAGVADANQRVFVSDIPIR
jgi:hypothetical protein